MLLFIPGTKIDILAFFLVFSVRLLRRATDATEHHFVSPGFVSKMLIILVNSVDLDTVAIMLPPAVCAFVASWGRRSLQAFSYSVLALLEMICFSLNIEVCRVSKGFFGAK
jgi:hypothetical protein